MERRNSINIKPPATVSLDWAIIGKLVFLGVILIAVVAIAG